MDFKDIRKEAESQGWAVDKTQKGHWRFRPPKGEIIVTSGTPSDYRAILNFVARLRRGGLVLEERLKGRKAAK
jgi:hypothetical protein